MSGRCSARERHVRRSHGCQQCTAQEAGSSVWVRTVRCTSCQAWPGLCRVTLPPPLTAEIRSSDGHPGRARWGAPTAHTRPKYYSGLQCPQVKGREEPLKLIWTTAMNLKPCPRGSLCLHMFACVCLPGHAVALSQGAPHPRKAKYLGLLR